MTYKMSDDERATIDWLNSRDGLLWSRRTHRQSSYAKRMFSIKDDLDFDVEAQVSAQEWKSWGHVDWKGEYQAGQREGWSHGVFALPEDEMPVVEETPLVTATAEGGVQVTITPEIRARWQEAILTDALTTARQYWDDVSFTATVESCSEQIDRLAESFRSAQGGIRVLGENIHELHEFQAGLPWSTGTPMTPEQRRLYDDLVGDDSPPFFGSPFRHGGLIQPVSLSFRPDPAYQVWYDEIEVFNNSGAESPEPTQQDLPDAAPEAES